MQAIFQDQIRTQRHSVQQTIQALRNRMMSHLSLVQKWHHHAGLAILTAYITLCCHNVAAAELISEPATAFAWPQLPPAENTWDQQRLAQLDQAVTQGEFSQISSVLIAQDGALVFERYYNGSNVDTLHDTRSATKSITSLLLGAAIAQDKISGVDAPVYVFFPDKQPYAHPDPRKLAIRIEDLLSMSSAWECNDDNSFSRGNEERMYIIEDWVQFALDLPIKGYAPWETKPNDDPYGRAFSYCTAGSFIIGAIIERATGQSLDDYAQSVLHQALGIQTVHWNHSPLGVTMGGGGTRYRSRDLLRIGELVRLGGRWQGRQILPAEWIEQPTQARTRVREGVEYGYFWWRMRFPIAAQDISPWFWAATGNGGNYLFIQRQLKLVVLITSQAYNTLHGHPQSQKMMREFILTALPEVR